MIRQSLLTAALCGLIAQPALADSIKIGFVTTLTTPAAVIGNDMKNAVDLAIEHIGGKMGDLDVELIYEDDGFRPEVGRQKVDKLVKSDDVDIVAGFIWSHVLLASLKTATDAGKFLISTNAGPSEIAGELCHENFFSTSWQNDQTPMAMGEVLNRQNISKVYLMAPNYAAGTDMLAGVASTFNGEVVGRDLTRWGADAQLDFSAELAKVQSSGAEALFVFYPGAAGGAFIKQYQQSGLAETIPLFTTFTVDALSLPRLQEAGLDSVIGTQHTQQWSPDLDFEQNKKFVSDFKAKFGTYPSFYAAQSYDAIFLIKSAVEAVNGNIDDMDAMREAFRKADYPSTRGPHTYGKNHFPIANFYLREVVADADGVWTVKTVETVFENHQDLHVDKCNM
jgi:branched-chain amino acid transport system substrate-binding protein